MPDKTLQQLCNEAYALTGYLRNNPENSEALGLLENTVLTIKQEQELSKLKTANEREILNHN